MLKTAGLCGDGRDWGSLPGSGPWDYGNIPGGLLGMFCCKYSRGAKVP